MKLVQLWRGWVEEVVPEECVFIARLEPKYGEGGEQVAEIYIRSLSPGDVPQLTRGRFLTWAIGERKDGAGHSWLRLRHGYPLRVMPDGDPVTAIRRALGQA